MDQGACGGERASLAWRLVRYYRDVVELHEDDPVVGACLVCRVSRCADWRRAVEKLALAGEYVFAVASDAQVASPARVEAAPLRSGDVVQVAEQEGAGLNVVTFQVTDVHGVVYLDDGPSVLVDRILASEDDDGEPRYAQVRVADIRHVEHSEGSASAA